MGSPYRLAPCGTIYAYRRHLRHMETPCRRCKDAVAAHVRARRARRREAASEPIPPAYTEYIGRQLLEQISEPFPAAQETLL